MKCERARLLMQEVLDDAGGPSDDLDRHLASCKACSAEWRRLQTLNAILRAHTCREVPAEQRERVIARAMSRIGSTQGEWRAAAWWPRLAAAAAAVIGVFSLGVGAGRAVWPREVTTTVEVPRVEEKIMRVEVPVPQEKIIVKTVPVIKEVPVLRERVVYRDRPVQPPAFLQRTAVDVGPVGPYGVGSPLRGISDMATSDRQVMRVVREVVVYRHEVLEASPVPFPAADEAELPWMDEAMPPDIVFPEAEPYEALDDSEMESDPLRDLTT